MISMQAVSKTIARRPVLHEINLNVSRGERVGLLGPNGAGKSTAFRVLVGMIAPDHGSIAFDGIDVTTLEFFARARLGLSYLPQETFLFRGLTVSQNLSIVLEAIEPDRGKRKAKLEALLQEFGLARVRQTSVALLSGGERRYAEIAVALACNPSFLLLDEPFAGLDPINVEKLSELLRRLSTQGLGIIITDHKARELLAVVERCYLIHSGRVMVEGKPDALIADAFVRSHYLGEEFRL